MTTGTLGSRFLARANPIWVREVRQSARLARTPWILFGITLGIALTCAPSAESRRGRTRRPPRSALLFEVFFSVAYCVVCIAGPAVAANAVASGRRPHVRGRPAHGPDRPADRARKVPRGVHDRRALLRGDGAGRSAAVPLRRGDGHGGRRRVRVSLPARRAGGRVRAGRELVRREPAPARSSSPWCWRGSSALYGFAGFGGSVAAHAVWPQVPEGLPVWLPTAYARAALGVDYLLLLVAVPLLVMTIPAWFLRKGHGREHRAARPTAALRA